MKRHCLLALCLALVLLAIPVGAQNAPSPFSPEVLAAFTPADNPISDAKTELGDMLFDDKRLSVDDTVACNTCHSPRTGFTTRTETSEGVRSQFGKRNAPTVLNAMFFSTQFWDGRAKTLEDQAKLPILNPIEMGQPNPEAVIAKLSAIPEYVQAFQEVFGHPVNWEDMGRAIAAFERTRLSGEAPIDRFLRGDDTALTAAQRRGWSLFNGKARCNTCHAFNPTLPLGSDDHFHNIGIAAHNQDFDALVNEAETSSTDTEAIDRLALETNASELGRFLVTRNRADIGAFKTPHLRDVVLTAPYMHDGSLPTLWDVIDHYNKGGEANPYLDGGIQRLGLTEDEIDDLVAVLDAFTSDRYKEQATEEMTRQRTFRSGPRKTRDTDAAMGRKGNLGDAIPDAGAKDPARIGGRPVGQ